MFDFELDLQTSDNMSELDCYVCTSETALGDSFKCEGPCARRMHAKCVNMNKTVLKAYIDMDNLFYMCDSCMKDSMKAISTKLDKIMSVIAIYDERVSRYETNMTELKDTVDELKVCVTNRTERVADALNVINKQCAPKDNSTYADKVKFNEPVVQECTKKMACKRCSGEHNVSECKSKVHKCTNCCNANKKLNLRLNVNHMAGSDKCKVTERQINIRRKRVQYKENA